MSYLCALRRISSPFHYRSSILIKLWTANRWLEETKKTIEKKLALHRRFKGCHRSAEALSIATTLSSQGIIGRWMIKAFSFQFEWTVVCCKESSNKSDFPYRHYRHLNATMRRFSAWKSDCSTLWDPSVEFFLSSPSVPRAVRQRTRTNRLQTPLHFPLVRRNIIYSLLFFVVSSDGTFSFA